jgi:hypothetical protein
MFCMWCVLCAPACECACGVSLSLSPCADRMYDFRLRPGDTLVFNNRRMLHGRTAFISSSPTSNRFLHGCYLNIDEFASRYRCGCSCRCARRAAVLMPRHVLFRPGTCA